MRDCKWGIKYQLVEMIKEKFVEGRRRYPFRDREFRGYMRKVGFEIAE